MIQKTTLPKKRCSTLRACEGFLACMGFIVCVQTTRLREGLGAVGTHVGALPGVDLPVGQEPSVDAEPLAAL